LYSPDLSGLSLQPGPSRLDEYSAGVMGLSGMDIDGDRALPQTVQHHPPPQTSFSLPGVKSFYLLHLQFLVE